VQLLVVSLVDGAHAARAQRVDDAVMCDLALGNHFHRQGNWAARPASQIAYTKITAPAPRAPPLLFDDARAKGTTLDKGACARKSPCSTLERASAKEKRRFNSMSM
jgi:hypothetical protein